MINHETKIILTAENLHACQTKNGGFTRAQVEMLGYDWPPTKGWIMERIGDTVTASFYAEFKAAGQIRAGQLKRMKKQVIAPRPPTIQLTGELTQFRQDAEFVTWLTDYDECWPHYYSGENYGMWRAWLAGKGVKVIDFKPRHA